MVTFRLILLLGKTLAFPDTSKTCQNSNTSQPALFWMGSDDNDKEARDNEKPKHQVELSEYAIGKYPITNREYQAFVKETNYEIPKHWKKGTYPSGKADHPVVYVIMG